MPRIQARLTNHRRTRIDEANSKTETDVEDESCNIATNAKDLSVCNWSIRDTDRMLSFLNAAKKMNKKLASSLKQILA